MLLVREIFHTIQGEGPLAGTPAVFIRLGGCNLDCHFCDTDFQIRKSLRMSVDEIMDDVGTVAEVSTKLIVITGGEPFAQKIMQLVVAAYDQGYRVQIETNGTLDPEWRAGEFNSLMIVVSPKTAEVSETINKTAYAWKYVVQHDTAFDEDGLPHGLAKPFRDPFVRDRVYLQPCDHGLNEAYNQIALDKAISRCLKYGHKLSLQTHKIMGLP